jgi:hypothetical protein
VYVQLQVYADAKGKAKNEKRKEVIRQIQEAVLVTFAKVVATVSTKTMNGEETCKVAIVGCTQTASENACCDITIKNRASEFSTDAIASVGVPSPCFAYQGHAHVAWWHPFAGCQRDRCGMDKPLIRRYRVHLCLHTTISTFLQVQVLRPSL